MPRPPRADAAGEIYQPCPSLATQTIVRIAEITEEYGRIANANCETWLPFLLKVRLTIPISHFMTPESSSHRDIPGLAIVVVGALCEGQFAIFDTDTSELLRFSEH